MKAILSIGILAILISVAGCLEETLMPSPSGEVYSEIDVYQEPIQKPYTGDVIYREADGDTYALVPVAMYKTSVLVVHTKHYSDEDSELVPVDLCVVWGVLAEPEYLQYATFIQEDRGCECIYDVGSPVDTPDILCLFVNIHLIPADDYILQAIKTIRRGQKVVLEGFLVDIYRDGCIYIETSRTRADNGEGSCEVLYVTRVRVGNAIYE
ncbi:MAG: hypothetical protein HXS44_16965 [Theionarchaea archaeon]|nr:hypothetical protein [Theionarchaea archaeon]